MESEAQRVAGLLGEPSRGRILACLMDGRARTAKELAFAAEVTAQTASSHLAKLVGGDVIAVEAQGRHRYFRITRPEVAEALEALMAAGGRARPADAEDRTGALPPIKLARFCYDHLAGRLGVEVLAALLRQRVLAPRGKDFAVTRRGAEVLAKMGVDVDAARAAKRRLACACLDWSERRPHLGGALGKELARVFLEERWIRRREESRAVTVTEKGRKEIAARFGLELPC